MTSKDPYRPAYHFRPERNWMNDPNGPLWYEGEYHLFYQYNPNGAKWGTIHWGHAASKDLIHWEDRGIAFYPERENGELHCYSGCAFMRDGVPVIFYTSVGEGLRGPEEGALQRCAISTDNMLTWVRQEGNVVDRTAHESGAYGIHISMWRDPFVFQEGDVWYLLLGGTKMPGPVMEPEELKNGRGVIALYDSLDGKTWRFRSILAESEEFWLLECPNMIPLGEEYLLLYSPMEMVRYRLGRFDGKTGTFETRKQGVFDYSIGKGGFYAPNTYLNAPGGRRIVTGWIAEAERPSAIGALDWAGMLSLPREVWLENGTVRMRPVAETEGLKQKLLYRQQGAIGSGTVLPGGRALMIGLKLEDLQEKSVWKLDLLKSSVQNEVTSICYREGKLSILRENSSLTPGCAVERIEAEPEQSKALDLVIFVDHSVIEMYVNESFTMTARVFPSQEDSFLVAVSQLVGVKMTETVVWEQAL